MFFLRKQPLRGGDLPGPGGGEGQHGADGVHPDGQNPPRPRSEHPPQTRRSPPSRHLPQWTGRLWSVRQVGGCPFFKIKKKGCVCWRRGGLNSIMSCDCTDLETPSINVWWQKFLVDCAERKSLCFFFFFVRCHNKTHMTSPSAAVCCLLRILSAAKVDVSQTCLCVRLQAGPRHGDERVRGPPAQDQELGARRRGRGGGSGRAGQPPACLKSSRLLTPLPPPPNPRLSITKNHWCVQPGFRWLWKWRWAKRGGSRQRPCSMVFSHYCRDDAILLLLLLRLCAVLRDKVSFYLSSIYEKFLIGKCQNNGRQKTVTRTIPLAVSADAAQ